MQCVKESLDPDFHQDFLEWQEATIKLTKSLVNSFENLHSRDQRNGNRKTSTGTDSSNCSPSTSASSSKSNVCKKLFGLSVAENSEQAQLHVNNSGGYLKSALYKPVSLSESTSSDSPPTPNSTFNSTHDYESFKLLFNELLADNAFMERKENPIPLYKRGYGAETSPSDV